MKTSTSLRSSILVLLLTVLTLSSCMTTRTNVSAYAQTSGREYTYAQGRQLWLFWGLIPLGQTSVNTPGDGNCQVMTTLNFGDYLISGLTGGILTSYTIKVKVKQ